MDALRAKRGNFPQDWGHAELCQCKMCGWQAKVGKQRPYFHFDLFSSFGKILSLTFLKTRTTPERSHSHSHWFCSGLSQALPGCAELGLDPRFLRTSRHLGQGSVLFGIARFGSVVWNFWGLIVWFGALWCEVLGFGLFGFAVTAGRDQSLCSRMFPSLQGQAWNKTKTHWQ